MNIPYSLSQYKLVVQNGQQSRVGGKKNKQTEIAKNYLNKYSSCQEMVLLNCFKRVNQSKRQRWICMVENWSAFFQLQLSISRTQRAEF